MNRREAMRWAAAGLLPAAGCGPAPAASLYGRGSSLVEPLLAVWADRYTDEISQGRVRVDYQPTGSGAGLQQFLAGTCDFACTDAPPNQQPSANVVVFPFISAAVVPVFHLPGVTDLRLSTENIAKIFLGTLTHWNDPLLQRDNPEIRLPALGILPVVRADASGSSLIFTNYLNQRSDEFRRRVGASAMPSFPCGIARPKTGGVAAQIADSPGSIGYVELGYAIGAKLSTAQLIDDHHSIIAAHDLHYPIRGTTHAVMNPTPFLKEFWRWCLSGEAMAFAVPLGFTALPAHALAASLNRLGPP
jgi:phosphate transport system substrate-binding protein